MKPYAAFVLDSLKTVLSGGVRYWAWLGLLGLLIAWGGYYYVRQQLEGLALTHLSDAVNWGLYISGFVYFGGIAAAALVLVIASHVYRRDDTMSATLICVVLAFAAVVTATLFILVDLGRPDRLWHMIPFIGSFNWPASMLTWDSLVLNAYMAFTFVFIVWVAYARYRGHEAGGGRPHPALGVAAIAFVLAMLSIEAFLFAGHVARPLWNSSVLVPHFLISALASGGATLIVMLLVLERVAGRRAEAGAVHVLGRIVTLAIQLNLLLMLTEVLLTVAGGEGAEHSAVHLHFGLDGASRLTPWWWGAFTIGIVAAALLSVPSLRQRKPLLLVACLAVIWVTAVDKSLGLVVAGFIPSTLGEYLEYMPALSEIAVSTGVVAAGLLVFTLAGKVVVRIEQGALREAGASAQPSRQAA